MNFKKILGAAVASVMAVSTMAVAANAATAGLGFQTDTFGFRNSILQSKAGWDSEEVGWEDFATWNYTDVTFDSDGQYTTSFEFSNDNEGTKWNVLKLYTDVSAAEYPDFKITIDKMTVDGTDVTAGAQAAELVHENTAADSYSDAGKENLVDTYCITLINTWISVTPVDPTAFGKKVELTFTVSGLGGGDNTAAGGDEGNGDTSAPTTDKNTPDTGVEGVAAVAGIAVLAAGAIIVAKKRK